MIANLIRVAFFMKRVLNELLIMRPYKRCFEIFFLSKTCKFYHIISYLCWFLFDIVYQYFLPQNNNNSISLEIILIFIYPNYIL